MFWDNGNGVFFVDRIHANQVRNQKLTDPQNDSIILARKKQQSCNETREPRQKNNDRLWNERQWRNTNKIMSWKQVPRMLRNIGMCVPKWKESDNKWALKFFFHFAGLFIFFVNETATIYSEHVVFGVIYSIYVMPFITQKHKLSERQWNCQIYAHKHTHTHFSFPFMTFCKAVGGCNAIESVYRVFFIHFGRNAPILGKVAMLQH